MDSPAWAGERDKESARRPRKANLYIMRIDLTSGNFAITVTGTLAAEKQEKVLEKGVASEIYRAVLPKVYVGLVGVDGKKGGKVLPSEFKRESLKFDANTAEAFRAGLISELAKVGFETDTLRVSEYVAGEAGSNRKTATEMLDKSKAKGKLDQLAMVVGYEGEHEDEAAFVECIHTWLQQ